MNLDASTLLASLFLRIIGFVLWRYGRKQERPPQMIAGMLLMVGPYFAPSATWTAVLGAVVLGGLWWGLRIGW